MPSGFKIVNEETDSENEQESTEKKKNNQLSTYQTNESRLVTKVNR